MFFDKIFETTAIILAPIVYHIFRSETIGFVGFIYFFTVFSDKEAFSLKKESIELILSWLLKLFFDIHASV
jgi:hypothetical protein